MQSFIITIIFSIILVVGLCVLESILSRLESPIPGLILPILTLLCPCLLLLQTVVVYEVIPSLRAAAVTFSVFIGPELLLLAIYFANRRQYRQKNQMDKMHIQDLE